MSTTTASNSVKTNAIDTIGGVAMTIGNADATSIAIGSSTAGRTPTIVIDTLSTANTNADPAIAIGTSSSVKTIKLGISTSSVHCSSIDIKGSAMNNISNAGGAISIGDLQTTNVLNIGTNAGRTTAGVINIGTGAGAGNAINIGTGAGINLFPATSTKAVVIGGTDTTNKREYDVFINKIKFKTYEGGNEWNLSDQSSADSFTFFGRQTAGVLNIAGGVGVVRAGNVNIASTGGNTCIVNMAVSPGTALIPTTGSVNIVSGSGVASAYTTSVSIASGSTTGLVTIGNRNATAGGNTTSILSLTTNIATGAGTSLAPIAGAVNIATGTGAGFVTTAVNIGSGVSTGTVTIGNTNNTVQMNGGLTMGTGKNITLQPTTSYVAPTSTQLGYVKNNFDTISVTADTVTDITSAVMGGAGTYIVTANFEFAGAVSALKYKGWITYTSASTANAKGFIEVPISNVSTQYSSTAIYNLPTITPTFYLVVNNGISNDVTGTISVVKVG